MSRLNLLNSKRALADWINGRIKKFTIRTQCLVILGIGIVVAITGLFQITASWNSPQAVIPHRSLTVPKGRFTDSTFAHYPYCVIGVLIPNHLDTGDSLWVATSVSRRFFIGNRIRWLEVPLDSLKPFSDTHHYMPLK